MAKVAAQPAGVPRPVPEFMQRRRIVIVRRRELLLARQVDGIRGRPVERAIAALATAMLDGRARCLQYPLRPLGRRPGSRRPWRQRRQAVDLRRIEHRGKKHLRPLQSDGLARLAAVAAQHRLAVGIRLALLLAEFPVLDGRALLALAHLRTGGRSLLVGHPALVFMAFAHQVQGVDALVALASGGIEWQERSRLARLPWLLPGRRAFPELRHQLLGDRFNQ